MPIEPIRGFKQGRRTLMDIPRTVSPQEIYDLIMASEGWPYTRERERMLVRDRSLVALLYVAELRVSELCRLVRSQFVFDTDAGIWHILGVKLSKEKLDKPRVHPYRELIKLPATGERAKFTDLVMKWVEPLGPGLRPYPFRFSPKTYKTKPYTDHNGVFHPQEERTRDFVSSRPLQITYSLTGGTWDDDLQSFRADGALWNHYFRAQGNRYLYRKRGKDLIRVSNEVKIDPRTLTRYLQSGSEEEEAV